LGSDGVWFLVQHGNSIGLVFDIVGATLLVFFGLPPEVNRSGKIFVGRGVSVAGTDPAAVRKAKRYECRGRLGLGLLIIGFLFQLIASIWARCP
jgi:hypothetical protein